MSKYGIDLELMCLRNHDNEKNEEKWQIQLYLLRYHYVENNQVDENSIR